MKSKWLYALQIERKTRYGDKFYGLLQSFIKPGLSVFFYGLFFGYFLKIDVGQIHFINYILSGLIIWISFSECVAEIAFLFESYQKELKNNLLDYKHILFSKFLYIYTEAIIFFILLLIASVFMNNQISFSFILTPLIIGISCLLGLALGFAIGLSSLLYKNMNKNILQVVYFLPWVCPIFYPLDLIPKQFLNIYLLNPLSILMEFFRSLFFNAYNFNTSFPFLVIISSMLAIVFLIWLPKKLKPFYMDKL